MTIRGIAGAAVTALVLGLGFSSAASAQQYLQPGMRTMIQQGGIEPGPLLGAILPGPGYHEPEWFDDRPVVYERRRAWRRHAGSARKARRHFAM